MEAILWNSISQSGVGMTGGATLGFRGRLVQAWQGEPVCVPNHPALPSAQSVVLDLGHLCLSVTGQDEHLAAIPRCSSSGPGGVMLWSPLDARPRPCPPFGSSLREKSLLCLSLTRWMGTVD